MHERFEPGIRAYLQRIRESVPIHPAPRDIEERRRNTERTHSVWQLPAPAHIGIEDWWVGLPGREVSIRLYRRRDAVRPPVVLYLHGGGFVASSYVTHDSITWGLAEQTGALVVSVNYRRAPENPYPAATDDCFGVLEWLARHGEWLQADTGRIALVGDSAGGCLATALAMQVRDRAGPPLRLQALLYPCIDPELARESHRRGLDPMLSAEMMRYFWDAYLPGRRDTRDPIAAPIRATRLDGLPAAFIAVGEFDPLRDESHAYAQMLSAAGVPVEFREVAGSIHGFLRARFVSASARAEFDRLCAVIQAALL